jgi:hypothetical protein
VLPIGDVANCGQASHGTRPYADLYVPPGHASHVNAGTQAAADVLPLGATEPSSHAAHGVVGEGAYVPAQATHAVAPVVRATEPCAHVEHTALPDAALYSPAAHGVHGPPVGPVFPAPQ